MRTGPCPTPPSEQRKRRRQLGRSLFSPILLVFVGVFPSTDGYIVHPQQQQQQQQQQPLLLQDFSKVIPSNAPPFESLISEDVAAAATIALPQKLIQTTTTIPERETPAPAPVDAVLSPLEAWCLSRLDEWYAKSQSLKCPFMRRRSGDMLDTLENVMKHTVIRKECWPLMGPPQAHRPAGTNKKTNSIKYKGLSLSELYNHVLQDWKPDTDGKGYYITGKVTTGIFRDDCLFLGPDPDMPIHGLRKYVGVASHLFDYDTSRATLQSLEIIPDDNVLVAKWTLSGILRLPWRPSLPTFSGTTTYHIDDDGLICCHEESWDCSVIRAFCHTLIPELADAIWNHNDTNDDNTA